MSAIAQRRWAPYVQPSFTGRATESASDVRHRSRHLPVVSKPARDPRLTAEHLQIDKLASLKRNWDGHGSEKPEANAVEHARQLLEDAFHSVRVWQRPLLSASEDGEVTFEWWNGARKLTLYVGPHHATYVKSWGPRLLDEMEDGEVGEVTVSSLWTWLSE